MVISYFDYYCLTAERDEAQLEVQRLTAENADMLAALKAFVEAYEKSLQLEKTDTALRLARIAIEKAEQPQ